MSLQFGLLLRIYIVLINELYTGTPNSDIRILCTVHCGRNVNKPSAPAEDEGKGLKLWCDIKSNKNKLHQVRANTMIFGFLVNMENKIAIYFLPPLFGLFPPKMMRCPWILSFDLLPLQYTDLTVPGLYISWSCWMRL